MPVMQALGVLSAPEWERYDMSSLFRSIQLQMASRAMRAKVVLSLAGLAFLALWNVGCAEIPIEPEVPELKANRSIPYDASELLVIVRSRIEGDGPDRKVRWVVFVDGEARALLFGAPGFTRIFVPPGPHEVIVENRMKSLGIALAFPVPVPLHDVVRIKTSLHCEARSRCGVAIYEEPPTTWRGLRLSSRSVPEDELEGATRGLTLTEPDR